MVVQQSAGGEVETVDDPLAEAVVISAGSSTVVEKVTIVPDKELGDGLERMGDDDFGTPGIKNQKPMPVTRLVRPAHGIRTRYNAVRVVQKLHLVLVAGARVLDGL